VIESFSSDSLGTRKGSAPVAATGGLAGCAPGRDCFAGSLQAAASEARPKLIAATWILTMGF
jgi:hypothetical protein